MKKSILTYEPTDNTIMYLYGGIIDIEIGYHDTTVLFNYDITATEINDYSSVEWIIGKDEFHLSLEKWQAQQVIKEVENDLEKAVDFICNILYPLYLIDTDEFEL